ncbi:MAG: glycoside hydrolase family 3 N-terminal domain-containing protein [Tabrizicola sp.]|uniref:glycoside hydrolase family 3 N-terminal domain-containing protein n=1 Tax=Tabrizicola sp. TaxID=2005166 RepID=UPI002735C0EE|nr:glycoside hydrolase family 3 N-terminal domain-containing protein [Tabrizicola sp.]MDP3261530.1 glycoside hydrolase family 3 N-terminal domain-containing protein [Tabrizicola sp.]MDP3648401.1 glycoside hydrolase family 3 N-terminal domain-containing protein [Paracoccaceae bacterium]
MDQIDRILSAPPFTLDVAGRGWVRSTLARMTEAAKVRHLFIHAVFGTGAQEVARLTGLAPAGFTKFFGPDASAELDTMDALRAAAAIPYLVSADLEGSRMSLPFGTEVPNPLALAAVDDVAASRRIAEIMAVEARAVGINWSFTPVIDVNAAFRSPIVATRGLGSDPARIRRHALAHVEGLQANGVAATAKHWPGEGNDDRDQHLLTTIMPLSVADWQASHGALYRSLIDAGVLAVMSAHIAFPAYIETHLPDAGLQAYRPASTSALLNQTLLRGELGFNGVIVSDATPMAGLGAWAHRDVALPELVASGCDIILFSDEPEADIARIEAALADGRITRDRLDAAMIRVLGLKAALRLPETGFVPADRSKLFNAATRAEAAAVTARAPTLVKDVAGILPLSPDRYRRVLVHSTGIVTPLHGDAQAFALTDMLRGEGFEVTIYSPDAPCDPRDFDLALFLMGEETLLTRGRIFLDWNRLMGGLHGAMRRHWHQVPTALISFGYPYYLYDAPRMPCVVNAYATMDTMQRATLDCLMGRAPFLGTSPVDPFCGLPDARF